MQRNRSVLITGASKGVGLALAERLVGRGYDVVGWSRSRPERAFPGEWAPCDLSSRQDVQRALDELLGRKEIDCLVNNAGWPFADRVETLDLDKLNASFDFHVRAALQTMQAVIPGMKSRSHGRIVNLLTTILKGSTGRTAYRAAKAGLMSLTASAALELAEFGITVNGVAPGPTATDAFYDQNPPGSDAEAFFMQLVPMARMGKPDEISAAIEFFLSEDASFATGQLLFVDGGMSVGRKLPN
jgi:3-oxoacyl-[acyl-carrier protein] reductase